MVVVKSRSIVELHQNNGSTTTVTTNTTTTTTTTTTSGGGGDVLSSEDSMASLPIVKDDSIQLRVINSGNNKLSDEEIANMLEKETFGDKRELLDLDDDDIITRHYGDRLVHFLYKNDVQLFDEIIAYRKRYPASTFQEVFDQFGAKPHSDGIIRIIFADEKTHWDAILKYDLKSNKKETEHLHRKARVHYERELLRFHLILVRERGADYESVNSGKEDLGAHFIKVMASFDLLTYEAESIRLKMEVKDRLIKVHRNLRNHLESNPQHFRPSTTSLKFLEGRLNSASTLGDISIDSSTPSAANLNSVSELRAKGVQVENSVLKSLEEYVEGIDGTFTSLFRHAFGIVPYTLQIDSEPFRRGHITDFVGGDPKAIGSSQMKVQLEFFSHARRNMLVNVLLNRAKVHKLKPGAVGINELLLEGIYADCFAVHDGPYEDTTVPERQRTHALDNPRSWLYYNWAIIKVSFVRLVGEQPLRQIRDYFGEKIAFYFAFLGFYTLWLFVPGLVGLAVFIYGVWAGTKSSDGQTTFYDNPATPWWTLFMSVWSVVFLEFWKRQRETLRAVWDVRELKIQEVKRPEWYGTKLKRSPVTGKVEAHFPSHTKIEYRAISNIVTLLLIGVMMGYEIVIILVHARLKGQPTYISSGASAILSLLNILFLTPVYLSLALKLNNFENHKTQQGFEDNLVQKNFLFNFVNNYSYLIYVGFIKTFAGRHLENIGIPNDYCDFDNPSNSCMYQLMFSMAIIFVGLAFVAQVQQVLVPMILQRWKKHSMKKPDIPVDADGNELGVPQYINDDILDQWVNHQEVNGTVVQFGFMVLFACAFPLAPLLGFLGNSLEIRFDAYRLVAQSQRPFVTRARGIGRWYEIMIAIARIGTVVNGLIMAFSCNYIDNTVFGEYNGSAKLVAQILFVIVFEHLVNGIAFVINAMIPDTPTNVRYSIERDEYLQRVEAGQEINNLIDQDQIELPALGRSRSLSLKKSK